MLVVNRDELASHYGFLRGIRRVRRRSFCEGPLSATRSVRTSSPLARDFPGQPLKARKWSKPRVHPGGCPPFMGEEGEVACTDCERCLSLHHAFLLLASTYQLRGRSLRGERACAGRYFVGSLSCKTAVQGQDAKRFAWGANKGRAPNIYQPTLGPSPRC